MAKARHRKPGAIFAEALEYIGKLLIPNHLREAPDRRKSFSKGLDSEV